MVAYVNYSLNPICRNEEMAVNIVVDEISKRIPACFSGCYWGDHDVFLRYGPEDTVNTFVDHLSTALEQQSINVYRDKVGIGQDLPKNFPHPFYILDSKIVVFIFTGINTRTYSFLGDLTYIMECIEGKGQTILPIFYDIEPSEVKNKILECIEIIIRHSYLQSKRKTELWRKALSGVANIHGLNFNQTR